VLSILINRAFQAVVCQNQIKFRDMSGTESESPLAAGRDVLGPGSWLFAICIAVLVAGGMALIMLFSSRAADSFVLAALAVLAMVGTFFLFGLAAGHIRIGETSEPSALLHDAVEQLGQGIEIAARDGSPVYANAAFREIVGVDSNGKPRALEEAFASEPVAAECLFRLMRAAERGETHEEEFRVRGADARGRSARWIRLGVRSLQKPGTAGDGSTLWHIADITNDRAREAEAVRDLEASLAYYDTMPVGLVAAGAGGAVTHLNATLAGWIGLDPGAIRSRAITLADIFADTGEALLRTAAAQSSGQTVKLELDIVRVDGVRIPVEIVSQPTRPGQGAELTALVLNRASASMDNGAAAADVSFARFFHAAPFGIATLDGDGRILSANGAFARMFLDERKGGAKGIVDVFARSADATAREAIGNALQQVVDGRASVEPIEISSGGEPPLTRRIYMSPIAQARRQGEVAVAYVIDATEQKSLELKFAQSQKMEAVGKLAGGIAHDFNNVLTAIIGFSDLLLQTHRPTDPAYKDIMNIKQNANRAAGLVRQLLAFSRQQTLQPEMLDLGEVLTDFSALLNRALGEKVELKILNGRDLWNVKADRTQFDQVILNLAVNAGDAMPNGGRLTIRTRNVGERDSVKLASLGIEQGEYVLIEVEDTGVGMPPEVMSKIFEPFYTTKDVGKGTGLGLSTVYGIIKQTGGYVFPESEVGAGTTFRIYLPRHIPDAEEAAEAKRAQKKELPRDLTGAGRVLLVEDEDSVRNFAGRALKRQGYEVFEASTGLEALEVVEREGDRIDIVVSDVVMPEMDGPTLLSELRGRNPSLKVIFISGYPDEVFKKSLDPNQQFAFLSKPFTLPQLAAKVKEELAR
jgi:two-component system cell cycle sensor histidine kinase/response regulator CckA